MILDGKRIADARRHHLSQHIAQYAANTGTTPGLATILVGKDPASEVYVRNKREASRRAGIRDIHRHLPGDVSQNEVAAVLGDLATDNAVSGILLQLPLPAGLDASSLLELIPSHKDVDGLTTQSAGLLARALPGLRPCTPSGIVAMLDDVGIELSGKHAVVVGRSELVGRPVSHLLLQRDATVTIAHSRTSNLSTITREADILVAAAGVPGLIQVGHVKKDAVVVDVGIHRTENGLTGDVAYDEVAQRAAWITPVPGGVGPMTIVMLLENTFKAHKIQMESTGVPTH